jgi:pimeloyl-ACP methyl ester carboxylesterase
MMAPGIESFAVDVPTSAVDDLQRRLAATRWPERETVRDWSQGVPLHHVQDLCRYWLYEYDWPARQARLNSVPQFVTQVGGLAIHFMHSRSPHPDALPLLLTHGWPGSVAEFLEVIEPLTNPADPRDAFHVVIPSLPGYGWSGKPDTTGWGLARIADAWAELMSRLGYGTFGAQGGDIGSGVSAHLGARHAERVAGVHVNMVIAGPPPGQTEFSEVERRALDADRRYRAVDSGYNKLQRTRPQTVGYALSDSPAGQCAWILEKFWAWSDCDGDPVASLGPDRILDHVAIYWFTESGTSSARLYWEMAQEHRGRLPRVPVPAGVSLFPHDIYRPPREWAVAQFPDLRMWHEHERGGHFAAMEQPEVLVSDLREFFRPLRLVTR